ncbi:MAG TPA: hypothetical protein VF698_21405 [Thermoanaerobaculia bacterium]
MIVILLNIAFGLLPTLILGASLAAGIDDDAHHRRMFLLVYGLWALTLSMWNWMRSYHLGWIVTWALFGVIALGMSFRRAARS